MRKDGRTDVTKLTVIFAILRKPLKIQLSLVELNFFVPKMEVW
jgi:hypothetical protein